jgi:tetratricopeptide (TPR) repeat protein
VTLDGISPGGNGETDRKLESWKEIAAYFGRDLRTVIRWEKELGLPVHRYPGKTKGRVYALVSELRLWAEGPRRAEMEDLAERVPAETGTSHNDAIERSAEPSAGASTKSRNWRIAPVPLVTLVVLAGLVGTGWWLRRAHAWETAPAGRAEPAPAHVPTLEARELYLKGRYNWSKRTPQALNRAVDYFSEAISRDPNYAQAYVGLADSYNLLREFATMPESEAYAKAYVAASRAVALDPNLAEAHATLGFLDFWSKRDLDAAGREFKRGIQLNPTYVDAYHWYGNILSTVGRYDEALRYLNRAQELDPASPSIQADRAYLLAGTDRSEEGIAFLRQMEITDPNFLSPHAYLAAIDLRQRNCAEFLRESEIQARLAGNAIKEAFWREAKKGYAQGGCTGMLRKMLGLQQQLYAQHKISAFNVAMTESLLGDEEAALQSLRLSIAQNETELAGIRASYEFMPLRSNPEFRQIVVEAGLPPLE